jgi:hypothetical protein
LPQLQGRCLMASSSRKGGIWLSRFYHRQAGLVVLIVNYKVNHTPFTTSNIFFWVLTLLHPISQLTLMLFELVSSRRTCSLVIDTEVPHCLQREQRTEILHIF